MCGHRRLVNVILGVVLPWLTVVSGVPADEPREIGGDKRRPVAVLSINDLNRKPLVVTVVPGTSAAKPHAFRNVVFVAPSPTNVLSLHTNFQCHQIRAIDHGRFPSRPAGRLARVPPAARARPPRAPRRGR